MGTTRDDSGLSNFRAARETLASLTRSQERMQAVRSRYVTADGGLAEEARVATTETARLLEALASNRRLSRREFSASLKALADALSAIHGEVQ